MKMKNLLFVALATLGLTGETIAQNLPNYVPANGLVGWWPFNGNANDESGNGHNGIVNGATATVDRFGNVGQAYNFDGVNDRISINHNASFNFTNNLTVSIWSKVSNFGPNNQWLIDKGLDDSPGLYNWGIASIAPGNFVSSAVTNTGDYTSTTAAASNTGIWNMWTYVYDGASIKLYKNDSIVINAPANGNLKTNTEPISVGYFPHANMPPYGYFYNGQLDDIGIWNRALTQQEISALNINCQLTVNLQPTGQIININQNVQFVVSASNPSPTYQWQTDLGVGFQNLNSVGQYNGTSNDTLTISNVTMSNNNQPFRCIINSGSCSDTSNVALLTVNNNVGVYESTQDNLFSVYPNPAQTVINVKADSKLIGEPFTVIDNTGRVVLSGKIGSENTVIDLGNLSNGVYLFNVGNNMKQLFKILKQ